MPKVDVIIPSYNTAKYLPMAIESVERQTFHDWKILLVDDGSTDNTEEVAAPFIDRLGSRIKYIRQPNAGLPAARNTAIRSSSSEFLALLDADDVWLPSRLAESLRSFKGHPRAGLSYGMISCITSEGDPIDMVDRKQEHGEGEIAPYIFMRKVQLPCPTITFRRQCVEDVGLFDETMRATEDRDLWFRIALKYEVRFVNEVIAQYRVSVNSMTTDPNRMLKAQLQFINKHYGAPGCGMIERRIALAGIYKQHAEALGTRRRSWAALASALKALSLYPLDINNARTAGSLLLQCAGLRR
jgi:glycosyltransferase involved in cell wall biosynthesis